MAGETPLRNSPGVEGHPVNPFLYSMSLQEEARKYFAERAARAEARRIKTVKTPVARTKAQSDYRKTLCAKYGITPEEYDRMHAEQDGRCAICKRPEIPNRRLSIDHDHATGKVRQLLCGGCNRGLGDFREDRYLLQAAIEYLTRHQA